MDKATELTLKMMHSTYFISNNVMRQDSQFYSVKVIIGAQEMPAMKNISK
jgi:hypothetical protein